MFKLQGYLEDKNYVAACLFLKNEGMPEDALYEITGEVARKVVDDLASEKNKEKILYLRSILGWLFKDVPGLATVYREQLRLASGGSGIMRDFARGFRDFADVTTGGASEEVADNLRPEVIQEKVKEFFSQTGVDIDDGIKKARDFFDTLAGRKSSEKDDAPRDATDDE
jgi:hypothetical protein